MNYGTLTIAQEYSKKGQQKEWLQLFLRNDGKNLPFADGLLLEERYYIGPVRIPLEILNFDTGTPEYLTEQNDIDWFYQVVERMVKAYQDHWDVPPLIVNYHEGSFEVNDGRHRYVCYHQMGVKEAYVLFWITGERDYQEFLKNYETYLK